jgi:hypothetical protein
MDAILVVLIMAVIILGPLGLIVWGVVRNYRRRNRAFELSLPNPWRGQDGAAKALAAVSPLMSEWRFRLSSQGEAGLVFSRTYWPTWLLIPCLLLFPIGLAALLYRRTVDVSFSLAGGPAGDDVAIFGCAPTQLQAELVERLSAPAT